MRNTYYDGENSKKIYLFTGENISNVDIEVPGECVVGFSTVCFEGCNIPIVYNVPIMGFSARGVSFSFEGNKTFHSTFHSWVKNNEDSYFVAYHSSKDVVESVVEKISETNIPYIL